MLDQKTQVKVKYALDRIFGILLFIFILPLLIVFAALIKKEDGGPVFFKQKRPGLMGKPFMIWKFRSMVQDADRFLDEKGSPTVENRVTKIGKILRFISLDEIPQLINIVRGDMSFIGPRPALYESVEKYTEKQKERFLMKPGITGLAQVNGRNLLKWSKRIEYDLEYIENYSLWLDVKILLKTVKVVLLREGIVLDRNPDQVDDLREQQ
jgi:undecaprenyl phosphate N,N'-diacetylbacillosamine 1-phosphate transferase